jgi:hypothetical protein
MAGQKRGFGKERHTAMKLAVTAASLAGFGVGWFMLAEGHAPLVSNGAAIQGATSPAGHDAGATAPVATRRARTSRGS